MRMILRRVLLLRCYLYTIKDYSILNVREVLDLIRFIVATESIFSLLHTRIKQKAKL